MIESATKAPGLQADRKTKQDIIEGKVAICQKRVADVLGPWRQQQLCGINRAGGMYSLRVKGPWEGREEVRFVGEEPWKDKYTGHEGWKATYSW